MKRWLFSLLALFLVIACEDGQSYVDNGKPAAVLAYVFTDYNRNGFLDENEPGVPGVELELSRDSCWNEAVSTLETDAGGQALFKDLNAGMYCLTPAGNYSMTTEMTTEFPVSGDTLKTVMIGLVETP